MQLEEIARAAVAKALYKTQMEKKIAGTTQTGGGEPEPGSDQQ